MANLTIADLRAQRSKGFGSILESLNKKSEYAKDDENFWKLEKDKAGNASATIRFLPAGNGEELPWVEMYSHGFQGPGGKWFIENCPTSIKHDCPVCEAQRPLWSGDDQSKKLAGSRKRRLSYIANILVISDPKHPENDGQVFYFKFGKKIFEKIIQQMQPAFEDVEARDVLDLFAGANFKLRMRQVEGFPNYDQSVFTEADSAVADSDEGIMAIVNAQRPLSVFVAPEKFKSYDALKTKMETVLSGSSGSTTAEETLDKMRNEAVAPAKKVNAPKPVAPKVSAPAAEADGDDMESYFRSLAE
jgi:hypothetical protein